MDNCLLGDLVARVTALAPGLILDFKGFDEVPISLITLDSREVTPGSLFCAVNGTVDGHDFVPRAVDGGASAVVIERPVGEIRQGISVLRVSDSRRAAALLSAAFFAHPSSELDLVGVTGTNGKTTIVTLLSHVANVAGRSSRSFGTLAGALTTAAAPEFQARLREAVSDGVELVAAEVSSHALDQQRVDGSRFRVSLFTNLTQDHLDYHVDMDDYFNAKARLFTPELSSIGIVDVSDEWGARLAAESAIEIRAIHTAAIADAATITSAGSRFSWRGREVDLPLVGRFNIANAVMVAEGAAALGYDEDDIVRGLETAPQVPGRFEWIDSGQPFSVVVDYSHTPASVHEAVATARELTEAKVILVFGSAGDRDPGKRPLMGEAASAADVLFVTSDNPRTEDPDAIIDDVITGITNPAFRREPDRAKAIDAAIDEAEAGDVVVIAGKGHEDYQIIGTETRDFDDRVVAREALAAQGWEATA